MGGLGSGGHNKKPTKQKSLEGNPGKRSLASSENLSLPNPEPPKCPAWLDREAKREWRRVLPDLIQRGNLAKTDRNILAGYCSAYSRWRRAEKALQDTLTQEARHGESARPEVHIAKDALTQMTALAKELGLTPLSRARMSGNSRDDEPKDAIDKYLNTRSRKN